MRKISAARLLGLLLCLLFVSTTQQAQADPAGIIPLPDIRPMLAGRNIDRATALLGMPQATSTVGSNQFIVYQGPTCVGDTDCVVKALCRLTLTVSSDKGTIISAKLEEGFISGWPSQREEYAADLETICNNALFPKLVGINQEGANTDTAATGRH